LIEVWNGAPDQLAVTQAAQRLEQALIQHPFAIGIARSSSVNRTATDLPRGIDYEIIEDDKLVRVLRVWSLV
jgi:hypothetical protein